MRFIVPSELFILSLKSVFPLYTVILSQSVALTAAFFFNATTCVPQARRVLYQALASALGPLLELVPPLLEHASGGSTEAASAARGVLRLQVSVVECLGQEVGPLSFVLFLLFGL